MEKADVVVIGAGPGGYVAAIRAAQLGKKVVLVEEARVGGICLNHGCIPSKAMINAASFLDKIRHASDMGIMVQDVSIDIAKMQQWKDNLLTKITGNVAFLCKKNNVILIQGRAIFKSSNEVEIKTETGTESLTYDTAILATGSKPIEVPSLPFDNLKIISSTEALALKEIPKNLVVVGGGYIGLELGTVYAKLGSQVTVVEMTNQLLPGNPKDVVDVIHKKATKLHMNVLLEAKANSFANGKISVETKEGAKEIDADVVLVAVGRVPNTKNVGLENTKVALDERGFVTVNEKLQSADPAIYAIGDISSGPMLAHKASHQGKILAEILAGQREKYDDALVPAVIFTDPEIAIVGMTEKTAAEKNITLKVGKFPFVASGRAQTKMQTEGFVKIIADASNDVVLGIEIVGADASDLIGEAALAIRKGTTLEELADTIHPHPTLNESLMEAAEVTLGKAIHIINPK